MTGAKSTTRIPNKYLRVYYVNYNIYKAWTTACCDA
jgi:hypothetical protein